MDLGESNGELILGLSDYIEKGRKSGTRYAVQEQDEDVLSRISDKGVPIYVQYIPRDKKLNL